MANLIDKLKEHILHTYKRSDSKEDVYKCLHPYCKHYINKDFLENKAALCPKCGDEFILTREKLKVRIPTCLKCSKSPKAVVVKTAEEVMQELMEELGLNEEEVEIEVELEEEE